MIPPTLNIAFFSLVLAVAPSAGESKAAQPDRPMVDPPATNPVCAVYAASCSRSFRKVGSYDGLSQARRAAQEHRTGQQAWIVTGNEAGAWFLLTRFRDELKVEGCSVYVNRCRMGMQLHSKTATLKQAEALAA